ncbi:NADPH-dependent oxidoreductase [Enterococcus cecorum]|uniref:NADPH-dependent oxidoreductase n=1 Tax=Enterococcus cecorum TaxID=44008 RepID=UPI00195EB5E5|nr:NADPH-dependent oxidoreductase [Enterococcus cecorum]MBM6935879.1 NADPH-dependent oxidoreductase [Enterococcus cecorum]
MVNQTIEHQLNHRSIRKFKAENLSDEQIKTLLEVARQTSTSNFFQQFSVLHITDETKREQIRHISKQPYVGLNGELFIFIADLYRNQQIRLQKGKDDGRLHSTDVFFQAMQDATLAIQNMMNAVESMGLGAVLLGSINNQPKELIKVLDLPKMTYPVLGIQVGIPDQDPQLKPRLPLDKIVFENEYPKDFQLSDLKEYDEVVQTYYDLRNANQRIDAFTNQIAGSKLQESIIGRDDIMEVLHSQGLCWR